MCLDPIPDELKKFKKLKRLLISKRNLFKKIAITHGKGEFCKTKGSIYKVPMEASNLCNILTRSAASNGLIVVKLKRDLKYRGYSEPVRPQIVYQALTYLKSYNKLYDNMSIAKDLSSEKMFKFSNIVEIQEQSDCATEKNVSDGKEMTENLNDRSETKFDSLEDPLNMQRTASNETTDNN